MVTLQTKTTINTFGWDLGGRAVFNDDVTVLQDAARTAGNLLFLTVMSQATASQKMSPLTDVDPALAPGIMTCGAIGGTLAAFAALASASFKIGIDGEAVFEVVCDLSGINSVLDTPGFMTCAALAVGMPIFQAVADAQFSITVDGVAINITADFSGINAENDTAGFYTCGTNGVNMAGWQAVTDGTGTFTINGVEIDLTGLDFSNGVTFDDIADTINYAANGRFTVLYDWKLNIFKVVSNTTGETSTVIALTAEGTGTDITAAGFLNGAAAGAATPGTGGEGTNQTVEGVINAEAAGRFTCFYDGDQYIFTSRTAGEVSSVSVLSAGAGGTDVSGAGFLNGAAGAATPGTGGENLGQTLADIINAELAGRATVAFDGDAFVFMSPTAGAQSAVSVLTAGATGTDISGVGFLNGLTGTGTITAPSGDAATAVPVAIFGGPDITEADIIAGDVTNQKMITHGEPKYFNEDKIVLENSLDLDDINPVTGKTIRNMLADKGLIVQPVENENVISPLV